MQYIYTALFTPMDDGSGYYAKVPDLPGCITTGNSLADAIYQITDAMSAWLVVAEDEGNPIAPPTPQDQLCVDSGSICSLISADTIEYRAQTDTHAVRKNVSLPFKRPDASDQAVRQLVFSHIGACSCSLLT